MFNLNTKKRNKRKRSDFLEPEEALFGVQNLLNTQDNNFRHLEISFGEWGVRAISWLGGILLILVLVIIFNYSIVSGSEFLARSQSNSIKFIFTPANRGIIYDRFGKTLASDDPAFDLVFIPSSLSNDELERKKQLEEIKEKAEMNDEDWNRINNFSPEEFFSGLTLKSNLSSQEVIYFESRLADLSGVSIIRQSRRKYYSPETFSHVLGYLSKASKEDLIDSSYYFNKVGRSGLEKQYDDILQGIPGKIAFSRDAQMNVFGKSIVQEPEDGRNIQTTIDAEFQVFLYNRLKSQTEYLDSKAGAAAIAMDSQTGEILALVSYPGFDIENISAGLTQKDFDKLLNSSTKPLFNRAISGIYSPGSTIKPIIAIAALEEEIITPKKQISTHGYISLPNRYNPDQPTIFKDWKDHGVVDMYSAIAVSSNAYFYILGGGFEEFKGLGIDRIAKYLEDFQFNQPTGIDILGENIGFVPKPENKDNGDWGIADTYHTSIGQGDVLVSPIRLITALNSIVNGGDILTPKLVVSISDEKGKQQPKEYFNETKGNKISLSNLEEVRKAMIQTVQSIKGTGYELNDLPFSVGGKSGTSQVFNNTQLNAIFFAFAPAQNPKISLLILIEKAKDGGGNTTPVVKDALMWYYQNRGFE